MAQVTMISKIRFIRGVGCDSLIFHVQWTWELPLATHPIAWKASWAVRVKSGGHRYPYPESWALKGCLDLLGINIEVSVFQKACTIVIVTETQNEFIRPRSGQSFQEPRYR